MNVTVDDQGLGSCFERIERDDPDKVTVEGKGSHLGAAAYLSVVLEEQGYRRTDLTLTRELEDDSRDVARLTVTLKGTTAGDAGNQQ